jgi:hypothetical protein
MEYFYSGGGNNRPTFTYRFLMKKITDDMYNFCGDYPLNGPFERWHIIHNYLQTYTGNASTGQGDRAETPLIQFESKKFAKLFRIAYSEYIIEDKSIYSLDE